MLEYSFEKHQKQLITQLQELKSKLPQLPKGDIWCSHQDKYTKWYHVINLQSHYICKKDRQKAEALAEKKLIQAQIYDIQEELAGISKYMEHHKKADRTQKLLADFGYQELLHSCFRPISEEGINWMKEEYETNMSHPENLIHHSISGNILRSKSEAIIDTLLYQNRIPYRYECKLQLGSHTLFPDFTIMNPRDGQFVYWEHFGMIDVPVYAQNYLKKMESYLMHQIIPDNNLICTFETRERPLSITEIQRQIDLHFT